MKRTIRLTESELHQLIKETINEVLGSVGSGINNAVDKGGGRQEYRDGYVCNELKKTAKILRDFSYQITALMNEFPDDVRSFSFEPTKMAEDLYKAADLIKYDRLSESVFDPYIGAAKSAYNSVFGNKRKVRGEENPKFLQAIKNGYLSGQLKRAAKIIGKYSNTLNSYNREVTPDEDGWIFRKDYNQIDANALYNDLNSLADFLAQGGKVMLRKKGQFYKKANFDAQNPQNEPTERMPMSTYKNRGTGGHMIDYSNMNSGTGYSY